MSNYIPKKLDEQSSKETVFVLIKETSSLISEHKYDDAAKHLILAAKILKNIPTLKRKKEYLDSIDKKKEEKKKELLKKKPKIEEDIIENNPFIKGTKNDN